MGHYGIQKPCEHIKKYTRTDNGEFWIPYSIIVNIAVAFQSVD